MPELYSSAGMLDIAEGVPQEGQLPKRAAMRWCRRYEGMNPRTVEAGKVISVYQRCHRQGVVGVLLFELLQACFIFTK